MDFTYQGDQWNKEKIESQFKSVFEWIYEESRIKGRLAPEEGSADQYKGYLKYQGPLGGEKDIKLDISTDEQHIDLMVYKLYELTYDEVLIVDPESPIGRAGYDAFAL